jgi:hypothetical protein
LEHQGTSRRKAVLVAQRGWGDKCSGLVGYDVFIFDREEDRLLYSEIKQRLKKFHYADIHGETDFLKIFINELIDGETFDGHHSLDFEELLNYTTFIRDSYALPELGKYFEWIINDCLLGTQRYEEYLNKTEPTRIDKYTQDSNLRLNLQERLCFPAEPVDITLAFGVLRKASVIEVNRNAYKKAAHTVFDNYLGTRNSWFDVLKEYGGHNPIYDYYLLQHLRRPSLHSLPFKISYFSTARTLKNDIKQLVRETEIMTRHELGIPINDDKWVSETVLFQKIQSLFPNGLVIHQGTPSWLKPQRFDVWVPKLNFAVEYNGKQHYEPVDFFGGIEGFYSQKKRDKRKKTLCTRNGVRLFIVRYDEDMDEAVLRIQAEMPIKEIAR